MRVIHTILLCCALGWSGIASANLADSVYEYRLDNGLKIIVKVDRRAPVAVSQIWYRVGASYETTGNTGLSHMLEHMMFKGTEKHGPGEFSRLMSENGASENAFTGVDYTSYFQQLESSRLALSFELEADRMRNLNLLQEEFDKEQQVVLEERRNRTDDDPMSAFSERFRATAYVNSPYRNPIIGWQTDIEQLTLADLTQWYQQWYAPNNATLVVVGDVDPEQVYELAKHYFGVLKPSPVTVLKPRPEVPQLGTKRLQVKLPAKLPVLKMGYKVPSLATAKPEDRWETYALEILAEVLDGDDSARLSKHLIRGEELAVSAGAGYDITARLTTLFSFSGIPAEGHTVAELEHAFYTEIEQLKATPVTPEELTRIKNQLRANEVYESDSMFYQGMRIGMMETIGLEWELLDAYLDNISAVTPEQIQAVAQKYLRDEYLTVGVLEPLPLPQTASVNPADHMVTE